MVKQMRSNAECLRSQHPCLPLPQSSRSQWLVSGSLQDHHCHVLNGSSISGIPLHTENGRGRSNQTLIRKSRDSLSSGHPLSRKVAPTQLNQRIIVEFHSLSVCWCNDEREQQQTGVLVSFLIRGMYNDLSLVDLIFHRGGVTPQCQLPLLAAFVAPRVRAPMLIKVGSSLILISSIV